MVRSCSLLRRSGTVKFRIAYVYRNVSIEKSCWDEIAYCTTTRTWQENKNQGPSHTAYAARFILTERDFLH